MLVGMVDQMTINSGSLGRFFCVLLLKCIGRRIAEKLARHSVQVQIADDL